MSWFKRMTYDNRAEVKTKRMPTINGRTWTRRMTWLEGTGSNDTLLKIKLEDDNGSPKYLEVVTTIKDAETIWKRFKEGQSIADSVSILGRNVPKSLQSRRAQEEQ